MKTTALVLKLVYSFINFTIPEVIAKEFAEVNTENC